MYPWDLVNGRVPEPREGLAGKIKAGVQLIFWINNSLIQQVVPKAYNEQRTIDVMNY